LKLGDLEFHILEAGRFGLDGGAMFGVIPKPMWEKKAPPDSRNRIAMAMNSLLIHAGGKRILVETGAGDKVNEKFREIYALEGPTLIERLRDYGCYPEDIDIVINTHLHFDHCGWNTVRNNKGGKIVPTFPRAKYYAPKGEWEYARRPSERDAISYIPDNYDPLVQSGLMTLLKGGEEIVPGISVKTFPGHTAHMQAVIVNGRPGFERARLPAAPSAAHKEDGASAPEVAIACYISDLIPTTAHIDLTWGMSFDLYPLQTIESKKQYYAKAIPEKWVTVFTHDPAIPWAYIEKDEIGKMVARKV
jgi:glyoxylase-like metal-dependent hydrolase (beta-lactamase superfamily II)